MEQKYKVFINGVPLVFTDNSGDCSPGVTHVLLAWDSTDTLRNLVEMLEGGYGRMAEAFVLHSNPVEVRRAFEALCTPVAAAGGIVFDRRGSLLMIRRPGKVPGWDLPKGKAERGEAAEQTAVREVEEECGIRGVRITAPCGITRHIYRKGAKRLLKETHWFGMRYDGQEKLTPEKKEGITEARWIPAKDISAAVDTCYGAAGEAMKGWKLVV